MNTYFDELVNLTADKWNVKVANSFGCSVDELKTNTSISGLRHIGDRIKIQIYNNTVICQYGNIDINKDIGCRTLSEWSYRPCGRGRK